MISASTFPLLGFSAASSSEAIREGDMFLLRFRFFGVIASPDVPGVSCGSPLAERDGAEVIYESKKSANDEGPKRHQLHALIR
jgi:hypothetical protein